MGIPLYTTISKNAKCFPTTTMQSGFPTWNLTGIFLGSPLSTAGARSIGAKHAGWALLPTGSVTPLIKGQNPPFRSLLTCSLIPHKWMDKVLHQFLGGLIILFRGVHLPQVGGFRPSSGSSTSQPRGIVPRVAPPFASPRCVGESRRVFLAQAKLSPSGKNWSFKEF